MAAVSAWDPERKACGGDGSAPSLDAGEPAAPRPAPSPRYSFWVPESLPEASGCKVRSGPGPWALPALPPASLLRPQGTRPGAPKAGGRVSWETGHPTGRSSFALNLPAGVGRGSSSQRELRTGQFGVNQGKCKRGSPEGVWGTGVAPREDEKLRFPRPWDSWPHHPALDFSRCSHPPAARVPTPWAAGDGLRGPRCAKPRAGALGKTRLQTGEQGWGWGDTGWERVYFTNGAA